MTYDCRVVAAAADVEGGRLQFLVNINVGVEDPAVMQGERGDSTAIELVNGENHVPISAGREHHRRAVAVATGNLEHHGIRLRIEHGAHFIIELEVGFDHHPHHMLRRLRLKRAGHDELFAEHAYRAVDRTGDTDAHLAVSIFLLQDPPFGEIAPH